MDMTKQTKMILSYSPQGGTGKSTLAVNAALIFAAKGFKTLLVDMSLYGSVISTLKIKQKSGQGIAGLINLLDMNTSEQDAQEEYETNARETINKGVLGTNLDVLVSAKPVKMEGLNEAVTNKILNTVRNFEYDVVIVDTSTELSIKNLVLIDKVDYILLSALQDVSCGWKLLMFKEIAQRFNVPLEKVGIVINRVSKYNGFNNKEFEVEIGYKILYEFPEYDKDFQAFINKGDLITEKNNKKMYKDFTDLAKMIFEVSKIQKK
jgi:MinD-like ATPase involved in chromosome partitioning or flagellar assembly